MPWRNRAAAKRPPRASRMRARYRGCRQTGRPSFGVVENDADGVAPARAEPAYAMAQVDAIAAARPLHRAMMHGKGHRVALGERHHFGTRLHARALLDQYELAALEIAPRFRQQGRDL